MFPVNAQDGHWVVVGEDYFTYLDTLSSYSTWAFNASRGPNARWAINCTLNGFGFNPTTVLICDEEAYQHWVTTGSSNECHFICHVNYSLHTSVDLPHHSQWYLILNNPGPITLYFTLRLTHYQWSAQTTTPSPNSFEGISDFFIYFVIIALLLFIILPCICRFSCCGFFRRRTKDSPSKKERSSPTVILVVIPEQLEHYTEEEDDH